MQALRFNATAPAAAPAKTRSVQARAFDNKASAAAAAFMAASVVAGSAQALTFDDINSLTYKQVKGTGIANTCPVIEEGTSDLKAIPAGSYRFEEFCLEPTSIKVKEESGFKGQPAEFVSTRLLTRLTYTLTGMQGKMTIGGNGAVQFNEEEGIDFAPTTVKLPGGEMVPFMNTMKQLNASGTLENFGGEFVVPSYRGASFLDPKGRGASQGYDTAVALPTGAGDEEELAKENIKSVAPSSGKAVFSTAKYDPETGEIAGVFESVQPSDTDLGSKVPKDVKISGIWYARLTK
ncbi:unnamed protein product [Pedinophyceae sp. YPF-701]|nr:unnamed protein product [Pedinophyceae sp. YPF-701]